MIHVGLIVVKIPSDFSIPESCAHLVDQASTMVVPGLSTVVAPD